MGSKPDRSSSSEMVGDSAFLRNIPENNMSAFLRFTNLLDSVCTRWIGDGVIVEQIKKLIQWAESIARNCVFGMREHKQA